MLSTLCAESKRRRARRLNYSERSDAEPSGHDGEGMQIQQLEEKKEKKEGAVVVVRRGEGRGCLLIALLIM